MDLNYTLDEKNLTDTYKTFYPKAAKYMFFSSVHAAFSEVDHTKTSLNKYKEIDIISSVFTDHNGMKPEIYRRKTGKFTNIWKLNSQLLTNQ